MRKSLQNTFGRLQITFCLIKIGQFSPDEAQKLIDRAIKDGFLEETADGIKETLKLEVLLSIPKDMEAIVKI